MYTHLKTLSNPEKSHALIQADNLVFLEKETSDEGEFNLQEKVDLIYLDPPYNTRNTNFSYDDNMVTDDWLTMMRASLTPATSLLKSTGVIMVSIDDSEVHRLRVLMDELFGRQNFITQLVIDGGANKNNSRFFSVTHEYMLVYANNLKQLLKSKQKWRKERDGVTEVMTELAVQRDAGKTNEELTAHMKRWLRAGSFSKRLKTFFNVDDRGLYTYADLSVPGARYEYDVLHPVTGLKCQEPSRGWGLSEEKFLALQGDDMIIWGETETQQPLKKLYLSTEKDQLMKSVLEYPSRSSTHLLEKLLGKRSQFTNPKNLQMMKDLIDYVTPLDGVVLDYFAGSGTTLHAVLELNSEQTRSERVCYAVTNNENNIFDNVAMPRIQKVATDLGAAVQVFFLDE